MVFFENNVDFIANVFWVNGRPFSKTPLIIEASELFAEARDSFDVAWMFVSKFFVELFEADWLLSTGVFFDKIDDFINFAF